MTTSRHHWPAQVTSYCVVDSLQLQIIIVGCVGRVVLIYIRNKTHHSITFELNDPQMQTVDETVISGPRWLASDQYR